MGVNPYSSKDQFKPEWRALQRQLAGRYTSGTIYDPRPTSKTSAWSAPSWRVPSWQAPTAPSAAPGRHAGPTSYPTGAGSSYTETVSYGPGLLDSLFGGLAGLGDSVVQHLWPLRVLAEGGVKLADVGWKLRLPLAILGAFAGAMILGSNTPPWPWAQSLFVSIAGDFAVMLALLLGLFVGWKSPSITGGLMSLTAHLLGFAIGLAGLALATLVLYAIVAYFVGWPPFSA